MLLFGVVTIVRWVIGPSAVARAIPHIHQQLLIIGTAVGLLITGLILSPPGRASGGHMNPAISLAMRRFGVFPAIGLLAYTAAQLSGSVLGALATGAVWMGHNLAGRVDGLPGCGGPGGSTHGASPKPDRKSAPRSAPPSTTGSPPQDCAQQPDKLVSTVEAIDPKGR